MSLMLRMRVTTNSKDTYFKVNIFFLSTVFLSAVFLLSEIVEYFSKELSQPPSHHKNNHYTQQPSDSRQRPRLLESQAFVLFIQRKRREGIHGRVGEPNWFVLLAVSAGVKMAFQHFQNVCVREMWVAFYHRPPLNLKITGDLLGSEGVPDSICLSKASR